MSSILEFLSGLGGTLAGARPDWPRGLVALHAISDAAIAAAYLSILAALVTVLRRRRDLSREVRRVGLLFIAFVVGVALTRIGATVTYWVPAYWELGILKALAAAFAGVFAIAIWPQIPKLLKLPSPRDLARANLALVQANASLEATVAWRTYELELAKQRFEQALSRSNITVFTQDNDLRYTWIHNPRLGMTEQDLLGRTAAEVSPGGVDESVPLKRRALDHGETVSAVISVPTANEGRVYLDMTVSPSRDQHGAIEGVLCTAVDVTEQRLFEVRLAAMAAQLGTAYHRFELALENSPISVFEQDADLRYTFMQNPPPGTAVGDYVGRTDFELMPEQDQRKVVPAKQRVLASGKREKLEYEVAVAGTLRFYDLTLEAKTGESGAVEGVIGTTVDLTERRATEKQMRLVMRELTHRSKNLLAVVQAMARKTASKSDDIEDFVERFSARLRALAAAHDLLVSQSWSGADIGELARAALAPTVDLGGGQVRMTGPALMVTPDTAQNLGLAFHELATNAAKYGALSVDTGRVEVDWERVNGQVHIRWRERGGPPVEPPDRRGFGRVLLERLVGTTLNGSVELDFRPGGLVGEIVFPDERVLGD
jgi:PAS domain S-box-containing protein